MADFRQYYSIDLPLEEGAEPPDVSRMAALWAALPREARCVRRAHPECEWGVADYILRSIDFTLKALLWARTKDGEKRRNKPKPIATPAEVEERRRRAGAALAARAEIDEILGMT